MVISMPHHVIPTFHIEPTEELTYRGEGNSSLVVALQSKRKVVRLLKSDAKRLTKNNDVEVHSLLLQHIDFNQNILPNTLPSIFFSPPQLICLDPAQLERIRHLVSDKRPSFRLDKHISNCAYALLMPDYCCIPKCISSVALSSGHTLSIEIKPKQGFLPLLDRFVADPTLRIKSQICRFGLSQFYKHQKESISRISSYCPLDLFSGCRVRSLRALFCLIDNPQNNFRVFSDAQLIYGDQYYGKSGSVEHLQGVLGQFLSKKVNSFGHNDDDDVFTSFCTLLLDSLYDDKMSESIDEKMDNDLSIVRELEKAKTLKDCTEPRFIRTFMQMFDTAPTSSGQKHQQGLTKKNIDDTNNNNINDDNINNNNNNQTNGNIDSPMSCLYHQSPSCCDLTGPCQSTLPKGCVLDSILQSQKLDLLDSSLAVQLYDKLVDQYCELKRSHYDLSAHDHDPALIECFANEQYCDFIDAFVSQNVDDLEKLWRFLISLTVKDCSIMVAIQRARPTSSVTKSVDILQQGSSMCTLVVDRQSGLHYVVSIAITDLDFKQPYKIERSLHNDRRMVSAFWKALRSKPSSFPTELVKSSQHIDN